MLLLRQIGDLLMPKYKPMLIPPVPWRAHDSGGHLVTRTSILRMYHRSEAHMHALDAAQERVPHGMAKVMHPCHSP